MVISKLMQMLSEIIGADPDDVAPLTRLTRDNGIEPIHVAKLVIACEKAFKITIQDEDVHSFERVKDVAKYIDDLLEDGRDDYVPPTDESRVGWYYE